MMKPLILSATTVLALAASFASVGSLSKPAPWRNAHYENVLGTSMEMKLIAASQPDADRAQAAALAEIKRLNSILSGYDPTSEFSRWERTRGEAVRVSPVDRKFLDKDVAKLGVVERLRSAHGIHGAVNDFRVEDSGCSVSFKGPGYAADVFIDRATGRY
jgi:hypothetical protein